MSAISHRDPEHSDPEIDDHEAATIETKKYQWCSYYNLLPIVNARGMNGRGKLHYDPNCDRISRQKQMQRGEGEGGNVQDVCDRNRICMRVVRER